MTTTPNTPTGADLTAWDRDHHLHPWEALEDWQNEEYMRVSGARGIHVWDDTGKRYMDGPGGMWCVQIGYGRKEMADAIARQVMDMPYASPWSFTSGPAAELAGRLAAMAPGDLNTVHFTTGGSTAVDTAIRTALFMHEIAGNPDKTIVISREKAYHGSTYLASSVTGKERFKTKFRKADDLVRFLPDVNPYRRPEGMSVEDWCDARVADLEALIAAEGAGRIAAFIAEPILCSGGVIVPPPGYHRRTAEICRANDILYISDEVVTGFGRLGHWFASEEVFGVVPDMITCAKGLTSGYIPLGACIISDRVMRRMAEAGGKEVFYNGYTYAAHPVGCAAALKNIEIMEREDILGHVRRVTPKFQGRMRALQEEFPIVGDARGMGLLGCLECRPDLGQEDYARHLQFGAKLDKACEEMGLLLRPFGNMAVFSPPLVITEAQIDEMFDIMRKGLVKLSRDYDA